jgi:tetratricopeptide (TPR) repeat protein
MKTFSIYMIITMLTGNPLLALIVILLLYGAADRAFLRILPDFTAPFRRSMQIRGLLVEIVVNPSNAKAALDLGILYFNGKRFEKALEYLERAEKRIDDSARLYLYKGMALIETGQPSEGATALARALELDKSVGYGLPYIYLYEYELKKGTAGNLKPIEDAFDRFANTENFYRMGRLFQRNGDKAKAREMFDSSLRSYSYCPRSIRRLHRRWALAARLQRML